MSNKQSSDDQIDMILSEAEDGLHPSRPEPAAEGIGARMRDRPVRDGAMPRGPRNRGTSVPRWLAPVAAAALIALVIGIVISVSQTDRLKVLESKVAALRGRGDIAKSVDDLRSEMQGLKTRVEEIDSRAPASSDNEAEIRNLKQLVAGQAAQIKSLSGKLSELEHASSRGAASGPSTNGKSRVAGSAKPTAGTGWVVNLIAVADPGAARQFERRLKNMGIRTRVDAVDIGGKSLQRVVATGFSSKDDARAFAAKAKKELGLHDEPWVSRD